MKRYISIAIISVMILSALAFTACGGGASSEDLSDSKYVGTWKSISIELGDASEGFEDEAVMVINGDGTGTFEGGEEVSEFTWAPTSDGFKTSGDVKLKFKDDGDRIKTKILGADLVFERQ